jgi:hypothetical protein
MEEPEEPALESFQDYSTEKPEESVPEAPQEYPTEEPEEPAPEPFSDYPMEEPEDPAPESFQEYSTEEPEESVPEAPQEYPTEEPEEPAPESFPDYLMEESEEPAPESFQDYSTEEAAPPPSPPQEKSEEYPAPTAEEPTAQEPDLCQAEGVIDWKEYIAKNPGSDDSWDSFSLSALKKKGKKGKKGKIAAYEEEAAPFEVDVSYEEPSEDAVLVVPALELDVEQSSVCPFLAHHLLDGDSWKSCKKCRAMLCQVSIQLARGGNLNVERVERMLLR